MTKWKVNGLQVIADNKHESFICDVFNQHKDARRNARLIAAAPELLEAARHAAKHMEELDECLGHACSAYDMLVAAIAKIEGR